MQQLWNSTAAASQPLHMRPQTLWTMQPLGAASAHAASSSSAAAAAFPAAAAGAAAPIGPASAASAPGAAFSPDHRSKRSRHVPSSLLASQHLPSAADASPDSPPPVDPEGAATLRPDFFTPTIQPSSRGFEAPHAATMGAAAAHQQQQQQQQQPHPHSALAQMGKKRQRSEGEGEVSAMLTGLRVDQDRQHAHVGAGAGGATSMHQQHQQQQHGGFNASAASASSSSIHAPKQSNPFAGFSSALAQARLPLAQHSSPTPSPAGSAAVASLAASSAEPRYPSPQGSDGEDWGTATNSVGSSPSPLPPSHHSLSSQTHAHAVSALSVEAMNQYSKSRFDTRSTSNDAMQVAASSSSAASNTVAALSSAAAPAASRQPGDPFVPPLLVESSVLTELARYVPAGTPGLSPPVLALMLLSKFDRASIPTLGAPLSSVQFLAGLRAVGCENDAAVTAMLHRMIRDFAPACSASNAFASKADHTAAAAAPNGEGGHDNNSFKIFYLNCFSLLRKLLCSPLKKSLDLSSARYFLGLLLLDRFSSHMHPFLSFLDQLLANQAQHDARTPPPAGRPVAHNAFLLPPDGLRMSFDQWSCLFEWVHQIHPHTLEGYKEDAAWPVLLDDFVKWMMDRSTVVRMAAKHAQDEAAAAHAQEAAALAREQQQQQKQRLLAASPLASSATRSSLSPNGHNGSGMSSSGGSPYSYSGLSRTPSRLDKFLIGPKAPPDPLEVLPLDVEEGSSATAAAGAMGMETLAEEGEEMQHPSAPVERASPAVQAAAAARSELEQRRARMQLSASHMPVRSQQPRPLGSPIAQHSSIMHLAAPRSMQHDPIAAMNSSSAAAASSSFSSPPARSPSSAMDDA